MIKVLIDRSTVEQALEALEWHYRQGHSNTLGGLRLKINEKTLRNLKAALAEPQEPDSPERRCGGPGCDMTCCQPVQEPQGCDHCNHPLYAATKCRVCGRVTEPTPSQRKPLSGVAIYGLFVRSGLGAYHQKDFVVQTEYDRCIERFARAVERAHGIKE